MWGTHRQGRGRLGPREPGWGHRGGQRSHIRGRCGFRGWERPDQWGGGWRGQRSPQVHCLGPQWTAAHARGDPDLTEAWPISETPKREPPGPQAVWTEPSAQVASGEPQGYGARTRDRRRSLSGGGVGRGAGGRSRSGPVSQGGPGGGRVLNLS